MAPEYVVPSGNSRKRQLGGVKVEYFQQGVRHRQRFSGGIWITELLLDRKWRRQVNVALPAAAEGGYVAHPIDGLCQECGHVYSSLMVSTGQPCQECNLQAIAATAENLQRDLSIELGWHTIDALTQRRTYGYRDPLRSGGHLGDKDV
jgi:hypothetical protein